MIALFGLTGDPVHNGHIRVVSSILDTGKYDKVFIHVSYRPKYKKPKASFQARLDMASITFGRMSSDINVIDNCFKYTSQVVKYIRKSMLVNEEIHFFTGYDWDISTFHNAEYLMKNVKQIKVHDGSINRDSIDEAIAFNSGRGIVTCEPLFIHSSHVRDALKEGRRIDGLVPESVNQYIKDHRLYGCK